MKKTIISALKPAAVFFSAVAAVMIITSCGKKSADSVDDSQIAEIESVVTQSTSGESRNTSHVDSLALMADYLTPVEAAEVLATYMQIAANARDNNDSNTRLVTMRKFVDVYDIVMAVNSSEMRPMFERLAAQSSFNIPQTATEFRAELSDYADGSAAEDASSAEQKADTAAVRIDTISTAAPAPEVAPENAFNAL